MGLLKFLFRKKSAAAAPKPPRDLARLLRFRAIAYYSSRAITWISLLVYILGFCGLFILSSDSLHGKTRNRSRDFDENALLPGYTHRYFHDDDLTNTYTYKNKLMEFMTRNSSDYSELIAQELQKIGLHSGVQRFHAVLEGVKSTGFNAYGILQSPRSDGTEAILISAPFTCIDGEVNFNGLALTLGMAAFVQRFSHWANDIIFVFPDQRSVGMKAWLQAYYGEIPGESGQGLVKYSMLDYHGGEIQEAVNLEFGGLTDYSHVGIFVEGLNGQQANADLIAIFVRLSQWENIPVAMHDTPSATTRNDEGTDYWHNLRGLHKYFKSQSLGFATYPHALFSKYRIEGITMRGFRSSNGRGVNLRNLSFMLESSLRSFNNLLERFHHSFWFYLKPNPNFFLPLGMYIGPVVMLSAAVLLHGLYFWIYCTYNKLPDRPHAPYRLHSDISNKLVTMGYIDDSNATKAKKLTLYVMPDNVETYTSRSRSFSLTGLVLLTSHLVGFGLMFLNMRGISLMVISTAIGLFSGIILIPQILAPHLTTKATTTPIKNNHQQDWRLLKSLLSIELGFGLVSIATLNPSLSVFLAVPTTPILMLIATHSSSTLVRIIKTLIVGCVCSPPLLVLLACIAESLLLSGGGDGLVSSSLATSVTIIDGAIYNWNVFGAWLYPFICLFYWPVVIATTTLTRFI